jgi:hypothetical protein
LRNTQELEKAEAEGLDQDKFENWRVIQAAVSNLAKKTGGVQMYEIPSRSLFLRRSEFPASKITADISLDGQRVNLHWAVRESIGGLTGRSAKASAVWSKRNRTRFRSDWTGMESSISSAKTKRSL